MKNLNTWPRFLGEPARFNVRSWRRTTLESVGPELESTLGLHFVHEVEENEPLWTCATPASDTRLRCWTSDVPGLCVFHFVGSSPLPPGKDIRPHGEVISDAV